MKTIINKRGATSLWMGISLALIILCLPSCARKIAFLNSAVVPAATGDVKVTKDDNKNYQIEISLANLAEPSRLTPSRNMYVVWMETDNRSTQNIGQITTASGFFGGRHKSSFKTVSSSKPTKIFLTAEDNSDVQNPGSTTVLSTDSF